MWYIDMSVKQPMVSAAKAPQVRCSAAYPTGAERMLRRENYCVRGADPLEMEEG